MCACRAGRPPKGRTMARTIFVRLAGVFLIVYGIAAILLGWWAYSVTHEAFTGVRTFTTAFEPERTRALDALQGATGIISGTSSPGSSTGTAPQVAEGLRDRLRGLLGG